MPNSEKRALGIAILGTLLVHLGLLAGAALLMAFGLLSSPEAVAEEPTYVMLSPEMVLREEPDPEDPERPKRYIRTSGLEEQDAPPEDADFISDRDTHAASESPEDLGEESLPSQDGIDVPTRELRDRKHVDGALADDEPQPEPKPDSAASGDRPPVESEETVEDPEASVEDRNPSDPGNPRPEDEVEGDVPTAGPEEVEPKPNPEETSKPPTPVDPASKPSPIEPDLFVPETHKGKVHGNISNKGDASVDAAATPIGRYMRSVTQAVEKRWHLERKRNAKVVSYGTLRLKFFVNRSGRPEDIRITNKDANIGMADFSLRAVEMADIPPMPEDIVDLLEGERLEITYDIIIY